jgi:hypothetical protein
MNKRDLQSFEIALKALILRGDRIARRWMLGILLTYFIALMAELWVIGGQK